MTRVDVFLQYYKPHVSGLTNMAAVLAEYAAAHGYDMHVHAVAPKGPTTHQVVDGVTVHAYRKTFGLRRASFSLPLFAAMWRMRRRGGIAHVHMPYPESFVIAGLFSKKWRFISTYQCDAPRGGLAENLVAAALDRSNRALIRRSAASVASSADYAGYTRLRDDLAAHHLEIVPVTGIDRQGGEPRYRVEGKRIIGFMGRPTHEKGIDVLLAAMDAMPLDDVILLFAGPVTGLTERTGYDVERMKRLVDAGRIRFVGFLEEGEIKDFYASLDVYVHPSINSFDAFGIVQLEAMSAGIPVVASDIPGVRTAVEATGFGEITKANDDADLLRGLVTAFETEYDVAHAREVLDRVYLPPVPQQQYKEIYDRVAAAGS